MVESQMPDEFHSNTTKGGGGTDSPLIRQDALI